MLLSVKQGTSILQEDFCHSCSDFKKTQRREIAALFWRFFRDVTRFRKLSSKLLLWGVHLRGLLILHQVWSLTKFCHLPLLFCLLPMPQLKIYSKRVQIIYHEKVSKRGKVIKSPFVTVLATQGQNLWRGRVMSYTQSMPLYYQFVISSPIAGPSTTGIYFAFQKT